MLRVFQRTEAIKISRNHVVSITGCDSGLGYSLAKYAFDLGFTVIATFLDTASVGARNLEAYCGNYLIPIHLDLTNDQSIKDVGMAVKACIQQNRGIILCSQYRMQRHLFIISFNFSFVRPCK